MPNFTDLAGRAMLLLLLMLGSAAARDPPISFDNPNEENVAADAAYHHRASAPEVRDAAYVYLIV